MDFYDEKEVLPYMPGMWREALQNICGIHSRYFNGKHQDCPTAAASGTDLDNEFNNIYTGLNESRSWQIQVFEKLRHNG